MCHFLKSLVVLIKRFSISLKVLLLILIFLHVLDLLYPDRQSVSCPSSAELVGDSLRILASQTCDTLIQNNQGSLASQPCDTLIQNNQGM